MNCNAIRYSRHAIERMFQRAVTPDAAANIVANGEIIATYPDECTVVTLNRPDPQTWNNDFKSRR